MDSTCVEYQYTSTAWLLARWVLHVGVDATVSTVRPSPLLRRLVDLDVLDDQTASIKTLGVGIGLGVLQER